MTAEELSNETGIDAAFLLVSERHMRQIEIALIKARLEEHKRLCYEPIKIPGSHGYWSCCEEHPCHRRAELERQRDALLSKTLSEVEVKKEADHDAG